VVRDAGSDPELVAAACGWPRGALGAASYVLRRDRLGVAYAVQGMFVSRGDGLLRLEIESPAPKQPFLADLFPAWVKALSW